MSDPAAQPSPCMFGCTAPVPPELAAERLCALHFTLSVEQTCAEIRRETAGGKATVERQAQIASSLAGYAFTLARVAIGAQRLSDELKKRILSTFLTLMVVRENLDRNGELELATSSTNARLSRSA